MKIYNVANRTESLIRKDTAEGYNSFTTRKSLTFQDYEVVTDPIGWYNRGQKCETEFDALAKSGHFVFQRDGYYLVVKANRVETLC